MGCVWKVEYLSPTNRLGGRAVWRGVALGTGCCPGEGGAEVTPNSTKEV